MQTRREMLASTLAAAGLTVLPATVHEMRGDEFLVVLRSNQKLRSEAHHNLANAMRETFKGTPLDGVKCVILDEGMSLEIVRKPS